MKNLAQNWHLLVPIEKNNGQISSLNEFIISSEASQSKNSQTTTKELELDNHNLLKDSEDMSSGL